MKQAIEKAIYYTDVQLNCIKQFEYSNKETFQDILNSLKNDIDIITFFASKDDDCFSIFKEISSLYEKLLLDKIGFIYLSNRKDINICLVNSSVLENKRTAILKLDSILLEYYSQKGYGISNYLFFFLGLLGGISTFSLFSKIKID